MAKAALLAAVLALGLAGWTTWKTSCPTCGPTCAPEPAPAGAGDVARLEAIERRLAVIEDAPRPAAPLGPTLGTAAGAGTSSPAAASADAAATARLDDLEKRLASVEESRKKDAESATGALTALGSRATRFAPKGMGWLATTEDAQKEFELTDGQKAEWDRIVADARRETEALRKIPDDEGKTWDQVQREMVADLMGSSSSGGATKFDFTKVMAFRNKTVPGRSETYGQADQRIKDEAKRKMRDTLSTAQAEKFDKAFVDPMLGGPGAVTASFALPVK
jgi:hypothetical protein